MSPPLPHDIIRFSAKTKEHIFEVCAPLYEAGCSLREIEEKTGFAKTSIREALTSRGLTMRAVHERTSKEGGKASRPRSSIQPYGYTRLDGKLVKEPAEYRVIQKILTLWRSGKSFTSIAKHLNVQKIPTRQGRRWHQATVGKIVRRPEDLIE